jgi:hypothetical protein
MLKGITQHGLLPILGLAFKIGLFIVTAINTYGILYLISQDRIWAAAGLILFEVGLLYWWLVFKNDTEASVVQMAISLMMFVTCLLLVAAANALHLGAISPDMLGTGTISKVVIMAVVVHLAASLFYPIASQEHMAALVNQIALGLVWARAQGNVMANLDRLAEQTQAEIEDRMWQTIQARIHHAANDRLTIGANGAHSTIIDGRSVEQPARAPRRSLRDRLFGRGETTTPTASHSDESNSTHDASRHDAATVAVPTPGQGDAPRLSAADIQAIAAAMLAQQQPAQPPAPSPNGQEVKPGHP